jgi:PKD repeat protein
MDPDTWLLDRNSEQVLFQTSRLEKRNHNAGNMAFGADGNLWVAVGDGGSRGSKISQNLADISGCMVRLTEDGEIPADNPWANDPNGVRCAATGMAPAGSPDAAICQEIFAYGLRNPFKIAMDPNAAAVGETRFFINDVGGRTWEEMNECGTAYAGANYGWPNMEGPCDGFGNGGNNVEGCDADPLYQDPEFWYLHTTTSSKGGCVVGGSFPPSTAGWPADFAGTFLYGDYAFGEIYLLQKDDSLACRECAIPLPGYRNSTFHIWPKPIALQFGPVGNRPNNQALYYASHASSDGQISVRRIVYVGGDNSSPVAIIVTDVTSGPVGLVVQFDATSSYDPDGDAIVYEWDFGDGSGASNAGVRSHEYKERGLYLVTLTVTDGQGGSHTVFQSIQVGDPPTAQILSPAEGTEFAVGDVLTLQGEATDAEGNKLADTSLTWEVRQHHDEHFHPFLSPTKGNDIELSPAPEPEDFLASTNSYLEIILIVTDADGLETTVTLEIQPKTVSLDFDTQPSGLDVVVYDYIINTPQRIVAWENHELTISAPDGEDPYEFDSWSDGGAQTHTITVPAKEDEVPSFVAVYKAPGVSPAPTTLQTAAPSIAQTTAVEGGTTAPQTAAPTVAQTTAVEGGTSAPQGSFFPPDELTQSPTETPVMFNDPGSDARRSTTMGLGMAAGGILCYLLA